MTDPEDKSSKQKPENSKDTTKPKDATQNDNDSISDDDRRDEIDTWNQEDNDVVPSVKPKSQDD